jgi:hypothetical protein
VRVLKVLVIVEPPPMIEIVVPDSLKPPLYEPSVKCSASPTATPTTHSAT